MRPEYLGVLFLTSAIVSLNGALWQISRRKWKQQMLESHKNLNLPPLKRLPIPSSGSYENNLKTDSINNTDKNCYSNSDGATVIQGGDIGEGEFIYKLEDYNPGCIEYRRVEFKGCFDNDGTVLVGPRSMPSQKVSVDSIPKLSKSVKSAVISNGSNDNGGGDGNTKENCDVRNEQEPPVMHNSGFIVMTPFEISRECREVLNATKASNAVNSGEKGKNGGNNKPKEGFVTAPRYLMVNRGWVPIEAGKNKRLLQQYIGEESFIPGTITGVFRKEEYLSSFSFTRLFSTLFSSTGSTRNDISVNYIDKDQMSRSSGFVMLSKITDVPENHRAVVAGLSWLVMRPYDMLLEYYTKRWGEDYVQRHLQRLESFYLEKKKQMGRLISSNSNAISVSPEDLKKIRRERMQSVLQAATLPLSTGDNIVSTSTDSVNSINNNNSDPSLGTISHYFVEMLEDYSGNDQRIVVKGNNKGTSSNNSSESYYSVWPRRRDVGEITNVHITPTIHSMYIAFWLFVSIGSLFGLKLCFKRQQMMIKERKMIEKEAEKMSRQRQKQQIELNKAAMELEQLMIKKRQQHQ